MRLIVETSFYAWRVEVDPEATRAAYAQLDAPDPLCCNACAAFHETLRREHVPGAVIDFLLRAGADPVKVQEVWGAPDGGFLNGWWVVVGRMADAEWDGSGDRAFVEPAPGFKCWITGEPSVRPPTALDGMPLLQLEFEWLDEQLLPRLASAWETGRPPGSAT